ncbi:MAG: hypothetical protein GQ474_08060 [Sulfurimonas sp.]|nr:hypothetical protein [Sulfurimonas sp.]
MKQSVNEYDFIEAFRQAGREDNFSAEGLQALFEWFEQYEEDCDTEIELDVVAICCEFTEYLNLEIFQSDYGEDMTMGDVHDNTLVIMIDDDEHFIIQDF